MARNGILIYMVFSFTNSQTSPYALIMLTLLVPIYFSCVTTIVSVNINRKDFDVALKFQKELEERAEDDGSTGLSSIDELKLEVENIVVAGRTIPFQAFATLRKGDIVKIAGPIGTGKSSFVKALLKFRPIRGVFLNGIPIESVRNQDLRSRIEYVPQNVPIVKGTLRDNLFLNRPVDVAVEEAFRNEPMLETIFRSKTFDTEILEGGANLSGGERQKIALARALMNEADVLILDEICSNIDQDSANAIYRRLAMDREKRITLIITHDEFPQGLANIELNSVPAALSESS